MSAAETGYAVVDTETTGLHPGRNERIVEVAVVHVSPDGEITGKWDTLVNPERDLGPQHVHHITAAEVRRAPTFPEIADDLAQVLAGRAVVAHNLRFDTGFLLAEYRRCGVDIPLDPAAGVCTMNLARRYLPGAGRSLADCCAAFDITIADAHRASADALADAELLAGYLGVGRTDPLWPEVLRRAASLPWPVLAPFGRSWYPRERAGLREQHFLSRLVTHLPDDPDAPVEHSEYLAVLDRALLDRHVSAAEANALVAVADELRIGPATAHRLHSEYLLRLAAQAWADAVVTDEERRDLELVTDLLGLRPGDLVHALDTARTHAPTAAATPAFGLAPGDMVVFTGEMRRSREEWEGAAAQTGLLPHRAVTKKVKLLVAADPDSLSGKAGKARDYGIPIVTEDGFARLLAGMGTSR